MEFVPERGRRCQGKLAKRIAPPRGPEKKKEDQGKSRVQHANGERINQTGHCIWKPGNLRKEKKKLL